MQICGIQICKEQNMQIQDLATKHVVKNVQKYANMQNTNMQMQNMQIEDLTTKHIVTNARTSPCDEQDKTL